MSEQAIKPKLIQSEDGTTRCWWCGDDPLYVDYHDHEWGVPVDDDQRLFEKICLEGFQSGLSWITILKKRENFRKAFAYFDFHKVARFNKRSVERLLNDAGIVRHRGKIESTINNAKQAIEMEIEFGSLSSFFWKYAPSTETPKGELRSTCEESILLSKDLKKRGWSFVGPTTAYAFMQAMGMVNDHLPGCHHHKVVQQLQECFEPASQP
ncbi:MAG: DNA-3-methyladenine glycosylase I [Planctomycetaceae bacterium]